MKGIVMTVYVIAEVKVETEEWIPAYASEVWKLVKKHNGKYLSRSGNLTSLEGSKDLSMIAIVEFDTREDADNFWDDPEYSQYKESRVNGAKNTFTLIDDTDVTGQIPYLKSG